MLMQQQALTQQHLLKVNQGGTGPWADGRLGGRRLCVVWCVAMRLLSLLLLSALWYDCTRVLLSSRVVVTQRRRSGVVGGGCGR